MVAGRPVRHGKPVMGSSDRPYGETHTLGFGRGPVAGFVFPKSRHEFTRRNFVDGMNLFKNSFRFTSRKTASSESRNVQRVPISWWKAAALVLAELLLFLFALAFFVLRGEGVVPIPSGAFGWLAAFAAVGVVVLHSYNKKIRIGFVQNENGHSLKTYREITSEV